MKTLVVSVTSGIGQAIYNACPGAIGTSHQPDSGFVYLNVLESKTWPTFEEKFDVIYFCVGKGAFSDPVEILTVNAIATYDCLAYLTKFMNPGGTFRIMASAMGSASIGLVYPAKGVNPYYKMSKAALNIGVVDLNNRYPGFNWQLIHPGFVETKMTKHLTHMGDMLTPEQSASAIVALPFTNGVSFINYKGETFHW